MNKIKITKDKNTTTFENIKHTDENGDVLPKNCPTPKKSLKELEKVRKNTN